MTIKFCVVGSPINHSLSPFLHRAAASYLNLDLEYEKQDVPKGQLTNFLTQGHFQGVSVTMPLKTEAFELAIERSDSSRLTGVANTLTRVESGWFCSNTDVYGIARALQVLPPPERIVLIGSGATTRSALSALADTFPTSEIQIMARSAEAASASVAFGQGLGLTAVGVELSAQIIAHSDLVLSLVPKDSFAEVWSELTSLSQKPKGWLFDVSYSPWPSVPAASWGSERVISGLEMLIWQATEQVEIFCQSLGLDRSIDRAELYSVMKAAVSTN